MSAPEAKDLPGAAQHDDLDRRVGVELGHDAGQVAVHVDADGVVALGLFSTTVATAPWRSTRRWSDMVSAPEIGVGVEEDALGEQVLDLALIDARLAEHLGGVLPEPRGGAAHVEVQAGELGGRADGLHGADDRVLDVDDHVAGEHVLVLQRLVVSEHRAADDAGLVQLVDPLVGQRRW